MTITQSVRKTARRKNGGIEIEGCGIWDRGRVTLAKEIRDQLGIEPNDEIPARLVGSVLELNPKPSSKLQTATAGRDSWENTTPADAGESLFGPMDDHE